MKKFIAFGLTSILMALTLFATGGCSSASQQTASSASGKGLYDSNCAGCHGATGAGSAAGTPLNAENAGDVKQVSDITRNGKGSMPGFARKLKDDQIQAIAKYVSTLPK